ASEDDGVSEGRCGANPRVSPRRRATRRSKKRDDSDNGANGCSLHRDHPLHVGARTLVAAPRGGQYEPPRANRATAGARDHPAPFATRSFALAISRAAAWLDGRTTTPPCECRCMMSTGRRQGTAAMTASVRPRALSPFALQLH